MTPVSDQWSAWRAAEGSLVPGHGGDAAARSLAPRQRRILRAMAALEQGSRAEIQALAGEIDDPELAAILEMTLCEPGGVEPSRVRAASKRVGVENDPYPALDLIRLLAVAVNEEREARPATLSKAARTRPVLSAVLAGLSTKFKAATDVVALERRSPRLAALCEVALRLHDFGGPPGALAEVGDCGAIALPAARWPEIEPPERRGAERTGSFGIAFEAWLDDPVETAWTAECAVSLGAAAKTSLERSQAALAHMLDALHRIAVEADPSDLVEPLGATLELVKERRDLPRRELLLHQLDQLRVRTCWWVTDERDEVAREVWELMRDAGELERAYAAREILPWAPGLDEDPEFAVEVAVTIAAFDPELETWVLPVLVNAGDWLPRKAFESGVRNVPEPRRLLLHSMYALGCDRYGDAIRLALRSRAAAAPEESIPETRERRRAIMAVLLRALREFQLVLWSKEAAIESYARAIPRIVEALGDGTLESQPTLLCALIPVASYVDQRLGQDVHAVTLGDAVKALVYHPPLIGTDEEYAVLYLMRSFRTVQAAEARFEEILAWLDEAPVEDALVCALRLVADLWARVGPTDVGIAQVPEGVEVLECRWEEAISAWLGARDPDLLGDAAMDFVSHDAGLCELLIRWADARLPYARSNGWWQEIRDGLARYNQAHAGDWETLEEFNARMERKGTL